MRDKTIKSTNLSGLELAVKIEFPDKKPRVSTLFAHCFTCNKNITAV